MLSDFRRRLGGDGEKPKPTIVCDVEGTLAFKRDLYNDEQEAAAKLTYQTLWNENEWAQDGDAIIVRSHDHYRRYELNKPLADALVDAESKGCKLEIRTGGDNKLFMRIMWRLVGDDLSSLTAVGPKLGFKPHDNVIAIIDDEPDSNFVLGCKGACAKAEVLAPTEAEKLTALVAKAVAGQAAGGAAPPARRRFP